MFNFFKKRKRVKARILSYSEFQREIIENQTPALVTFSAGWCPACKMQKPLIHDVADVHQDKNILIALVDTDAQPELSREFQIQGIPTTIAFKNTEVIFRKSGLLSRDNLEQIITELTKTSL